MNGFSLGRGRRLAVLTLALVAATASFGAFFPHFVQPWLLVYPGSASHDNVLNGQGDSCQLCQLLGDITRPRRGRLTPPPYAT